MNKKKLIGMALVVVGTGVLAYLYTGYYKPRTEQVDVKTPAKK
jgi:hypothetical protein